MYHDGVDLGDGNQSVAVDIDYAIANKIRNRKKCDYTSFKENITILPY
jgi:hypothetical protein